MHPTSREEPFAAYPVPIRSLAAPGRTHCDGKVPNRSHKKKFYHIQYVSFYIKNFYGIIYSSFGNWLECNFVKVKCFFPLIEYVNAAKIS